MADCHQCDGHGEVCVVCEQSRQYCQCAGSELSPYGDPPPLTGCPVCAGSGKDEDL